QLLSLSRALGAGRRGPSEQADSLDTDVRRLAAGRRVLGGQRHSPVSSAMRSPSWSRIREGLRHPDKMAGGKPSLSTSPVPLSNAPVGPRDQESSVPLSSLACNTRSGDLIAPT